MQTEELIRTAKECWGAALVVLGFNHSRSQLSAELINQANNRMLDQNDARFVASYGLAQSGYGGGL